MFGSGGQPLSKAAAPLGKFALKLAAVQKFRPRRCVLLCKPSEDTPQLRNLPFWRKPVSLASNDLSRSRHNFRISF
jgi:hypothetical protein